MDEFSTVYMKQPYFVLPLENSRDMRLGKNVYLSTSKFRCMFDLIILIP